MTYGRFDVKSRRLDFVDCGHTPLIHFHSNTERCWRLKGRSSPLGFMENEIYNERYSAFREGDIFFLYSDGISDARNQKGEFFGELRLVTVIEQNYGKSAQAIIRAVKDAVIEFCEGNPLADDLTCVAVKLRNLPVGQGIRKEKIFAGKMTSLSALRRFIRECLDKNCAAGLSSAEKAKIIFAGNEAASNIITHGVSRDDAREPAGFSLEVEMHPGWFAFRFLYGGKPFIPPEPATPRIEDMNEHGYGIFIMDEFMDSIIYGDDARGGRMITMAKCFNT
jgi:sigma-B regulation protein RsbU (phosphoserine phosphatase)